MYKHGFAAALLFSALTVATSASDGAYGIDAFDGTWSTNWGTVWAESTDNGYQGWYEEDNGRFILQWDQDSLSGYWAEDKADVACDYQWEGTVHWGRLLLVDDYDAPGGFRMYWGYCEGPIDREWKFKGPA